MSPDGVYCRRLFSISPDVQRQERIGNIILRLWHAPIADPVHRSGALSAVFLIHHLFSYERKKWLRGEAPERSFYGQHVRNILTDLVGTTRFSAHMIARYALAKRKYPALTPRLRTNTYALNFISEQEPNPDSQVRLSERRDHFGMPRIHIDWRYTDTDVRTIKTAYRVFAEEIARSGVGHVDFSDDEVDLTLQRNGATDGHQIGTTRMSDDPALGVVDSNCRVHGLGNLFVASSSVFPTSSHALPTLSIVAMAVRLAAHIRNVSERPVTVEPMHAS
jgi:choline dehydrogenase-like flavoprotein